MSASSAPTKLFQLLMTLSHLAMPKRALEALRRFDYVPYSALTPQARSRAATNEATLVVGADGSFIAKGLDRSGDRSISVTDWLSACQCIEKHVTNLFGEERGHTFVLHHRIVVGLATSHSWPVARDYCIRTRELLELDHRHDISTLNANLLTLVATSALVQASQSPLKHSRSASPEAARDTSPTKRSRSTFCFRCGIQGPFPSSCSASATRCGHTPLSLAGGTGNKNNLATASGQQVCFDWSSNSRCKRDNTCRNAHICTLCGGTSHGASSCTN